MFNAGKYRATATNKESRFRSCRVFHIYAEVKIVLNAAGYGPRLQARIETQSREESMTVPELKQAVEALADTALRVKQENEQAFERIFGDEKTN